MKIGFNRAENRAHEPVSQKVVVEAGVYQFRAFVRTEGIAKNHEVGFRLLDAERPSALDVRVLATPGSEGWEPLSEQFTVPDSTRLLEIRIVRGQALNFDTHLAGTFWIDDVSLRKAEDDL